MHDAFDVLQHHDRIVDDDTDGEHHAKQGERIDRIAQQMQSCKGTNQGHRHSGEGNQCGAPVLQEHKDDDKYQRHRFGQGLQYFTDRNFNKACCIVGNGIGKACGEFRGERDQRGVDFLGDIERVGTGLQENTDQRGGLAVVVALEIIILGTQFDACNVLQA